MLVNINADIVLASIVEAMLPRGTPEYGLVIQLDLRAENYKTKKDHASLVTFIFNRPSNYTKVLMRKTDFRADRWLVKDKEIEMSLESDHDSCWRSDGFRVLSKDWQEKVDMVGHPYGENKKDISFWSSISIFEGIKYIKFKNLSHSPGYEKYVEVDREGRTAKFVIEEICKTDLPNDLSRNYYKWRPPGWRVKE